VRTLDKLARETLVSWMAARRKVLERNARRGDIHAWRVATRRLSAVARLLAPARDGAALDDELRRAFRAAGRLREDEVCIDLARRFVARHEVAKTLAAWLARRQPRRRRRALRRIGRVDAARVRRIVRGWLGPPGGGQKALALRAAAAQRAARRLTTALQDLEAARAALSARSAPHALHRLRIGVKNVRYMADCLAGLPGGDADAALAQRLAARQAALGEIADLAALVDALDRFARNTAGPPSEVAALRRELIRRQRRCCAGVLRRWRAQS
jgi:CHAD domain-containing protein